MDEVRLQLGPLSENVHRLDKRLCSLYSNGSGGPPGALEIWRAEDRTTFESILESVKILEENRIMVNKFVEKATERQDRWDKVWGFFWKHWWKAAVAFVGAIGTVGGIVYHQAAPVVRVIIQEYIHEHPNVGERLKNMSTQQDPDVSSLHKQQEVDLPASFDASR